ncbi:hypothetical protein [Azospirillum sp. sgz302134]
MLFERTVRMEVGLDGSPTVPFFRTLAVWLSLPINLRVVVEGLSGRRYNVWRADDGEVGLVAVEPDEKGLLAEITLPLPDGFWDLART